MDLCVSNPASNSILRKLIVQVWWCPIVLLGFADIDNTRQQLCTKYFSSRIPVLFSVACPNQDSMELEPNICLASFTRLLISRLEYNCYLNPIVILLLVQELYSKHATLPTPTLWSYPQWNSILSVHIYISILEWSNGFWCRLEAN